jgi:acyl-CoA thioesterase FadM
VIARTLWVFLNERGRPARIPATYQQFWELSGGSPLQEEAEWPAYPAREPFTTNAPVRFSDLDVMSHMNNTAYVELLDNAGWEAFASIGLLPDSGLGYPAPLYYDIEYLESAKAGETLQVHSWFEPVAGAPGQWERLQRVERGGTALVRARSRWQWEQQAEPTPAFEQLWKG